MRRNVGGAGESKFSELCNLAGINVNSSRDQDYFGWDYFLEIASQNEPSHVEIKVQVKSTDKQRKHEDVKVSVLHRLALSPTPSFFAFMEYDGAENISNIFIVHLDKKHLENILKKVRRLEAEGKKNRLNKHKLRIKYSDKDSIGCITSENLRNQLLAPLTPNFHEYIKNKINLIETLGFESTPDKLKITFPLEACDVLEELAKVSLGLKDSIKAEKIEATQTRFGIELPNEVLSFVGDLEFSMPNLQPTQRGKVFFQKNKISPKTEFSAEIYLEIPNLSPKDELPRFKISTELFDIIKIKKNAMKLKPKWGPEKLVQLVILKNYLFILSELTKGQKMEIGFVGINNEEGILGNISTKAKYNENLNEALSICNSMIKVCTETNILPTTLLTSYDNLFSQKEQIYLLHSLLSGDIEKFGVTTNHNIKTPLATVMHWKNFFGDICIAYAFALLLQPENQKPIGDNLYSKIPSQKVFSEFKRGSFDEIKKLTNDEISNELVTSLKKQGYEIEYVTLNSKNY